MVKRLLVAMGLTLALVVAASPAAAQQYPPSAFFFALSDTTVVPGQTVTASGAVTPGATSVSFTFFSVAQALGGATPDADGNFSASITIPSNAALGSHTITATDDTGLELSASLTVVAAGGATAGVPAAGAGGALPTTGSDSLPLARIGAVLLAAGGVLILAARRRRDAREPVGV